MKLAMVLVLPLALAACASDDIAGVYQVERAEGDGCDGEWVASRGASFIAVTDTGSGLHVAKCSDVTATQCGGGPELRLVGGIWAGDTYDTQEFSGGRICVLIANLRIVDEHEGHLVLLDQRSSIQGSPGSCTTAQARRLAPLMTCMARDRTFASAVP